MYIWKHNQRRCNPFATYVDDNGTTHSKVPANLYEGIADPQPPAEYLANPEHYYVTEQDDAPYVVWTRKSDEQIAQFEQSKINEKALAYLAETDWMVTRFAETGVPIPDEVKAARQAARQAARDSIVKLDTPQ